MNEKYYLFYENKSIKQRWADATLTERILCVLLAVFLLFLVLMGVVLGIFAEVENRAVVILIMIGIQFFIQRCDM